MVVVFDTNVLIPLILPASRSTRLFLRLQAAGHEVVISRPILEEVRNKMLTSDQVRKWLSLPPGDIVRFLENLPKLCGLTPGTVTVRGVVTADPDDDVVLAAAGRECSGVHCPGGSASACVEGVAGDQDSKPPAAP